MNSCRAILAQYCDDVRQETGNKFSLMGCYGTNLLVKEFPATLPKLCVLVEVQSPVTEPFKSLTIRVVKGEQVLAELTADPQKMVVPEEIPNWARFTSMKGIMMMTPFHVEEPCYLRVQAETEAGLIESGRFSIDRVADAVPTDALRAPRELNAQASDS